MGIINGFLTMLQYYSTDFGVLYFLMLFIFGAIWWLIAGGLVLSVGIIFDVYTNEREGLGKVIVFPFFVTAIGLILFCASLFSLPVKEMSHFPLTAEQAATQIVYLALAGIVSAVSGVIVQYFINRRTAALRKQEIIETI
jgi:putative membrane protein